MAHIDITNDEEFERLIDFFNETIATIDNTIKMIGVL